MIIEGANLDTIETCAAHVGARVYRRSRDPRRLRIVPAGDKYRRVSHTGRKIAAVCWHGHLEFFRQLFTLAPGARVQTAFTRDFPRGERWYTAENLERMYQATDRNIGSMYQPMYASEACEC